MVTLLVVWLILSALLGVGYAHAFRDMRTDDQ